MESELIAIVKALPAAAGSPLASVLYLATVVAWTAIAWRVQRHAALVRVLGSLPAADRLTALRDEMGVVPLTRGLTPEQYLRGRIHLFLLIGAALICATTIIIVGIAAFHPVPGKVSGSVSLFEGS